VHFSYIYIYIYIYVYAYEERDSFMCVTWLINLELFAPASDVHSSYIYIYKEIEPWADF